MSTNDDRRFFEGDLLPEFDATPTSAWHAALASDLGDNWDERLRWDAGEGLDLLPFYRAEDLDDMPTGVPGAQPGWRVRCNLTSEDPAKAKRDALAALDGGADALGLLPLLTRSTEPLRTTLADIDPAATALHLEGQPEHARRLFDEAERRDLSSADLHGSLAFDPTVRRLQSDAFDAKDGYHRLAALVREAAGRSRTFRLVTADARPFHAAGAGPIQSLALALAAMSEHFAQLTDEGIDPETVAAHAQIALPVGTRFFVEVARLRAARRLFARLAEAYDAESSNARLQLQAQTAWRPVTLYDPHLNLLRGATAGAAAAVIGGADVLAVRPFDAAQNEQRALAVRLALNAQHILREEAHLGRVADPAAGSYHAEVLTEQIARRAWARFQKIEAGGGLLAALQSGDVQERLADARANRQNALTHRQRVRVGTNHYPNLGEERLEDAPDRDGVPPRETDAFERLRLATERHVQQQDSDRPAAFLLPVGTPKIRSARANFARSVLGCAGFRALENVGFDTVEAGARAAVEAVQSGEAQLIACAAPNDDYAALLSSVHAALDEHDVTSPVPVVVAGRADALPEAQREIADAYLHRGMDLLETIESLQERLGISRHGSVGARGRGR